MMDLADTPRQNDADGHGNLSQQALEAFALWFLKVCLDQVTLVPVCLSARMESSARAGR